MKAISCSPLNYKGWYGGEKELGNCKMATQNKGGHKLKALWILFSLLKNCILASKGVEVHRNIFSPDSSFIIMMFLQMFVSIFFLWGYQHVLCGRTGYISLLGPEMQLWSWSPSTWQLHLYVLSISNDEMALVDNVGWCITNDIQMLKGGLSNMHFHRLTSILITTWP